MLKSSLLIGLVSTAQISVWLWRMGCLRLLEALEKLVVAFDSADVLLIAHVSRSFGGVS